MVVAGMVVLGGGELLGGSGLGGGVEVLNLGLTEDAVGDKGQSTVYCRLMRAVSNVHVGVTIGGLVDLGGIDNEENL